jgi:membrane protein required for colicin V production
MNVIDIILIIPLVWFAYKGFANGLVLELASILALLLGIYLSVHFSAFVGTKVGINGQYASLLAFIITFIAVVILVQLLARVIDKAFKLTAVGVLNKIGGILFGILKIALILSILFYIIDKIDTKKLIVSDKNRNESKLIQPIEKIAPALYSQFKKEENK